MSNSLSHALPYPIKGARFTLPLSFRVADGTPTDPTTPDTELSTDGGASFADAAEEITTGGANGAGYLTLTGAETDNNVVQVAGKSANCLVTPAMLFPRVLAQVGTGMLSAGSAGGGTLGTLLAYDVTGCFIKTTGGTGGGGTGGANNQARKIVTYDVTTGAFTVAPNWETTPDATTTYAVLLPEGVTLGMLRALNPATAGRTVVVDANGLIDATTVKLGPSGSATAQAARDIGTSVLLSTGTGTGQLDFTDGIVKSNLWAVLSTVLTESVGGYLAAAYKKFFDVATPTSDMNTITAVGTATALGTQAKTDVRDVADAALTAYGGATTTQLNDRTLVAANYATNTDMQEVLSRFSLARAGYLDNLNVGGAVASQADINALNQSASRRLILTTVGQYERPETGTATYQIEARVFTDDGVLVNADTTPTLTGTGISAGGSLAANISSATNPSTGIYRWAYTVEDDATLEQARFDLSATVSGSPQTISVHTQIADFVAATLTTADLAKLTAIYNKLPSKSNIAGTNNSDGDIEANDATGNFPGSVGSVVAAVSVTGDLSATMKTSVTTAATAATPVAASVTGSVGSVVGSVGSVVGSVGSVTGSVGSVTGAVTVGTNNDKTGYTLSTTPPTKEQIAAEIERIGGTLAAVIADTENLQARLPAELTGDGYIKADALKLTVPDGHLSTAKFTIGATGADATGFLERLLNAIDFLVGRGKLEQTLQVGDDPAVLSIFAADGTTKLFEFDVTNTGAIYRKSAIRAPV
jgi:hypothetical protein